MLDTMVGGSEHVNNWPQNPRKGRPLTALLELEPREAGTEIFEPAADFGTTVYELHERGGRCYLSNYCRDSWACTPCTDASVVRS
jgi:hypothetical protein